MVRVFKLQVEVLLKLESQCLPLLSLVQLSQLGQNANFKLDKTANFEIVKFTVSESVQTRASFVKLKFRVQVELDEP